MTVSPTLDLASREHRLAERLARSVVAVLAFALLGGVWLAYFMVVPFDFHVR